MMAEQFEIVVADSEEEDFAIPSSQSRNDSKASSDCVLPPLNQQELLQPAETSIIESYSRTDVQMSTSISSFTAPMSKQSPLTNTSSSLSIGSFVVSNLNQPRSDAMESSEPVIKRSKPRPRPYKRPISNSQEAPPVVELPLYQPEPEDQTSNKGCKTHKSDVLVQQSNTDSRSTSNEPRPEPKRKKRKLIIPLSDDEDYQHQPVINAPMTVATDRGNKKNITASVGAAPKNKVKSRKGTHKKVAGEANQMMQKERAEGHASEPSNTADGDELNISSHAKSPRDQGIIVKPLPKRKREKERKRCKEVTELMPPPENAFRSDEIQNSKDFSEPNECNDTVTTASPVRDIRNQRMETQDPKTQATVSDEGHRTHSAGVKISKEISKPPITNIVSVPDTDPFRSYRIPARSKTSMTALLSKINHRPAVSSPSALKLSRRTLSKIAPLHPNRRTPPPPPPKVIVREKKTKAQRLEEELWEAEWEEVYGEAWYDMSEEEKAKLFRERRDQLWVED